MNLVMYVYFVTSDDIEGSKILAPITCRLLGFRKVQLIGK